jgi:penicillin-binding protein 2
MKLLRNPEREVFYFQTRLVAATAVVLAGFVLLLGRFAWLQVVKHADFYTRAEQNRIALVPVTANRGLIRDRNGVIIAKNYSAYTLEIAMDQVKNVDATIDELSRVIPIEARDRRRFHKLIEDYKRLDSVPIRTRLTDEEVARFAAQAYRFPGVELRARLFRQYPLGETASHVLGYIGRVSINDEQRIDQFPNPDDYKGTEYIGKIGVESSYEQYLHGTTGTEQVEITAGGHPVRTLARTPSEPGENLILSIDIRLQQLVEQAFGDRKGALIAIEPDTGDVLAFVSKPTFDPNLFVDGIDPQNWDSLNSSPDKPLLNRALRGTYPIGSTYKPFLALAALELGKRRPDSVTYDPGYFWYAGREFREGGHIPKGGYGNVDLHRSIVVSSDVYYYVLANDLGVDAIHDFMKPFGFGQLTGIDLEGELTGVLPSSEWKERRFHQKWYGGETISIGIGQGYNSFTLLQLAHATATLANGGIVMKPHVVRAIEDPRTGEKKLTVPTESGRIRLNPRNLEFVRDAMVDVNLSGTGRAAFVGATYRAAGKTGTAQVVGIAQNEKYNANRIEEAHRDHALFIAFAPADPGVKPRIALALLVENGGWGAEAAAPIARKVFDYYLLGKLPPQAGPAPHEGAVEPVAAAAAPQGTVPR